MSSVRGDQVDLATTLAPGVVQLATTGGTTPGTAVDASDPRTHEATHISGGSDAFLATDLLEAIIKRIRESGGPTVLLVGSIPDGQFLKRSGTNIVGAAVSAASVDSPRWVGDGTITTLTDLNGCWVPRRAGTIKSVVLHRRLAGTSGNTTVDMNKNQTTIFTTQANRPSVSAGGGNNQISVRTNMDVTAFVANDQFQVDVDLAETGGAKDMTVIMEVEYT